MTRIGFDLLDLPMCIMNVLLNSRTCYWMCELVALTTGFCMVVARLTLVVISITRQEGPSKLLVLLRILGNLLHDLVDISFVISALWTISLCKVILKKKLSYLIGILKKSRCIWNWKWFEECSFGKVKYDIQIIERWLVEKRSSVNLKKKKIKKKKDN